MRRCLQVIFDYDRSDDDDDGHTLISKIMICISVFIILFVTNCHQPHPSQGGLLESPKMPLTTTLAIAKVQNEIMKQIGVSYDV